jgi:hypothetical protein
VDPRPVDGAFVAVAILGAYVLASTLHLAPPNPAPTPEASGPLPVSEVAFRHVHQLTDPLRIPALIVGDSNIFGPLGKSLQRSLGALGFDVTRLGKPTSGLARPDFFDWMSEARKLLREHQPDLVIAMFGGNDGQRMEFNDASGEPLGMQAGELWQVAYQQRVREFALLLRGNSRRVFILSPTNRRPRFAREKMNRVRAAQRAALEGLAGVSWVDMFPLSSDASGDWLAVGADVDGNLVRFRREDGIHLTPAGAQLVGQRLLERLLADGLTLCGAPH